MRFVLGIGLLLCVGCASAPKKEPVLVMPPATLPCRAGLASDDPAPTCTLPVKFQAGVDQTSPSVIVCVFNPTTPDLLCMTFAEAKVRASLADQ
jgi:hypothetical protein